jgi:hypothetical protein
MVVVQFQRGGDQPLGTVAYVARLGSGESATLSVTDRRLGVGRRCRAMPQTLFSSMRTRDRRGVGSPASYLRGVGVPGRLDYPLRCVQNRRLRDLEDHEQAGPRKVSAPPKVRLRRWPRTRR